MGLVDLELKFPPFLPQCLVKSATTLSLSRPDREWNNQNKSQPSATSPTVYMYFSISTPKILFSHFSKSFQFLDPTYPTHLYRGARLGRSRSTGRRTTTRSWPTSTPRCGPGHNRRPSWELGRSGRPTQRLQHRGSLGRSTRRRGRRRCACAGGSSRRR